MKKKVEKDDELSDLLRESEMQRLVLAEFRDEWINLALGYVTLLRDANATSAQHRRTAELLEIHHERTAVEFENAVSVVKGEQGDRFTPRLTMRFNAEKGWHRNED